MTDLEKFVWGKCESPVEGCKCGRNDINCKTCDDVYASEITLAHVLKALRESAFNDKDPIICSDFIIDAWGDFYLNILKLQNSDIDREFNWDFTKNFNEQSLETQQAIAKLLGWEG